MIYLFVNTVVILKYTVTKGKSYASKEMLNFSQLPSVSHTSLTYH